MSTYQIIICIITGLSVAVILALMVLSSMGDGSGR